MRTYLLPALLLAFTTAFTALPALAATQSPKAAIAGQMAGADSAMGMINLNTADQDTLQRELAGIGATRAAAIVAHRESRGNFASVDELLEVQGIGKSLLDRNRERLTVQ